MTDFDLWLFGLRSVSF